MDSNNVFIAQIKLDHSSPVPLYHQISEPLKQMIMEGKIPSGAKLEDELSMAKRLGVSRPTARRALQALVDLRLVVRKRAVGTIVAPKEIHRPVRLSSLYDDLKETGQKPTTDLLYWEEVPAPQEVAEELHLSTGDPVVKIVRLRRTNGQPLALMTNYLIPEVAPTMRELKKSGLYEAMRRNKFEVVSAQQKISARKANAQEAEELGEPRGAAILTMHRLSFDLNGHPIEVGDHIYRASRYSFTMNL